MTQGIPPIPNENDPVYTWSRGQVGCRKILQIIGYV